MHTDNLKMVRKTGKKHWLSWIKENVGWLVGLLTIVGTIFTFGRWTASLEYKAEINEINAQHYREITSLRDEQLRELLQLQYQKQEIQNELNILKNTLLKEEEVRHE